jgi:hypothetical protein
MTTIPTWGYHAKHGARIFDLPAHNPVLPEGWHDSPAKIPAGRPGKGGEPPVAASHPPPQASPPLTSIDDQEQAEHARVLAENATLKARVAELEAQLAGAVAVELPTGGGLPPVPGADPTIREILTNADPAPPPTSLPEDVEALRERAKALGIEVDQRWGAKRLQREIAYRTEEDSQV